MGVVRDVEVKAWKVRRECRGILEENAWKCPAGLRSGIGCDKECFRECRKEMRQEFPLPLSLLSLSFPPPIGNRPLLTHNIMKLYKKLTFISFVDKVLVLVYLWEKSIFIICSCVLTLLKKANGWKKRNS